MRERHDYVVPYFNDKYRFDKPPFIYWTQIVSYRLFGENALGARFPSSLAAAMTAVLLFGWGRRIGRERTGWWAAIIFTLCFQTFIHGKAAVADMWLVFFVTAAHWAGFELLTPMETAAMETARPRAVGGNAVPEKDPRLKYWRFAFYTALGLAFLAKGPLGWIPLLTVASSRFFVRDISFYRRFWFVTGVFGMLAIVCAWGIPALVRTNGEFFRVGIGRHVVERSFGVALEGHGGNSFTSYLANIPYYFVTVFITFFPWSIKLPALVQHLWRKRDRADNYLVAGVLIIFVIMTIVKTKLPHYTLTAFPLLALLLGRHLFELRSFFGRILGRFFPTASMSKRFAALPPSRRFAARTAVTAAIVWLAIALILFPRLAPAFPAAALFKKSRADLLPGMDFATVDFYEPSVVWTFRAGTHGFFRNLNPDQVEKFMTASGPRFVIVPTNVAKEVYPQLPPLWKSYQISGFNPVKWKAVDLTLILKPTQ